MNNFNLKRNKIFRVLPVILALSLLACGCGANTDKAENEPQKNDAVVSIVPDTAQTNEDQQVSVKSGESFYKLQVQEAVLDESAVLAAWIPSFDAGQVSSTTTSEGNAKQTTLSGITYCWTMNGNSFDGYTLGGRTELNIIYMPYLENGKNMLIPVYEVSVLNTDGDPMFCAVLDALTGYVYSAQ